MTSSKGLGQYPKTQMTFHKAGVPPLKYIDLLSVKSTVNRLWRRCPHCSRTKNHIWQSADGYTYFCGPRH